MDQSILLCTRQSETSHFTSRLICGTVSRRHLGFNLSWSWQWPSRKIVGFRQNRWALCKISETTRASMRLTFAEINDLSVISMRQDDYSYFVISNNISHGFQRSQSFSFPLLLFCPLGTLTDMGIRHALSQANWGTKPQLG